MEVNIKTEKDRIYDVLKTKAEINQDMTIYDLAFATNINQEKLQEILNDISKQFIEITKRRFLSVMVHNDADETADFFRDRDVDLALLTQDRITDIKNNMKRVDTMGHQWIIEKWKLYRGY